MNLIRQIRSGVIAFANSPPPTPGTLFSAGPQVWVRQGHLLMCTIIMLNRGILSTTLSRPVHSRCVIDGSCPLGVVRGRHLHEIEYIEVWKCCLCFDRQQMLLLISTLPTICLCKLITVTKTKASLSRWMSQKITNVSVYVCLWCACTLCFCLSLWGWVAQLDLIRTNEKKH